MNCFNLFNLSRFSLILSMAVFSAAASSATLIDALNDALKNDFEYRAAKAQLKAGQQSENIGRAGLLPQISGTASKSMADVEQSGSNPGQPAFAGEYDSDSTNYGIQLDQAIFNVAAWQNYKRQKAVTETAEIVFATEEQNIIQRTAEAYLNVLEAEDNLRTAIAEEKALNQSLEQTKQRFEVGLTAITGVHEAQAAYDSAVANRLLLAGQVGVERAALEVITGKLYPSLAPLQEQFPVLPPEPAKADDWIELAYDNNYSIMAAKSRLNEAERFTEFQRAGHYPTVNGRISWSDNQSENDFDGGGSSEFNQEQAGITLSLNVPLFSGGGVSAQRRQAAYQESAARETFLLTKAQVARSVKSAHLNVVTSAATVKARKQAIVSGQSALDATQAGYEVGTRDLVDVLNAQQNLFRAQRDYYETLYRYINSSLNLQAIAGSLDSEDIQALNQYLKK